MAITTTPAGLSRAVLPPILPGVALCAAVSALAYAAQAVEARIFGHAWIEALVLAILLGAAIRTAWNPPAAFRAGIGFSAKSLLEVAVLLLGASVTVHTILAAGPWLLGGIVATVALAIGSSYAIGRALRLPVRMAVLIACGNSICGNSAIAAVAPVIGADGKEVASAIAFTAVLGVAVVLLLPFLAPLLGLTETQYGVLAGLTVYAVPQVLAATAPIGTLAVQLGTLVKLVRVLMLGPVVLALSLLAPRMAAPGEPRPARPGLHKLVPWFIVGFLLLAACRSVGLVPDRAVPPLLLAANGLTTVSMAALGLGVDVRTVARAGPRVTATVTLSLLVLGGIALALIHALRLG